MSSAPDGAVLCRGVTKAFGSGSSRVAALRGVDLAVAAGELFMLVGPSGCGKTTLISVIAGILDHDGGSCRILGHDLDRMRPRERIAFRSRHVGFVFQAFNLLPALTATENVAVPLILNGLARRQACARAEEYLDAVGIADRRHAFPSQLSGGQQQRVAIARALVHGPGLVVCDEPTSALDHENGARVMDLMRRTALDGQRTLIIVTHDSRIFPYADRIAHMDDGQVERVAAGHGEVPSEDV